jgi:hypothetical protein
MSFIAIAGLGAVVTSLAGSAGADAWEPTPPISPYSGSAAPATADTAATVVGNLQASNYRVILNKFGNAPLSQCLVTAIQPGTAVTTPVTAGAKSISNQVLFTTVYVTADCTHRN